MYIVVIFDRGDDDPILKKIKKIGSNFYNDDDIDFVSFFNIIEKTKKGLFYVSHHKKRAVISALTFFKTVGDG